MNRLLSYLSDIMDQYHYTELPARVILLVLLSVLLLSVYEFLVYRVVSHRAFYNKSFHISVAVLPFFISTIILCLQSNLVITLGTIGALAIIRFRTAVKDPVDMVYLLWSVHTGIVCGCQLYEVAVLTSLVVTIVLLVLENIGFSRRPFVLVVHSSENAEAAVTNLLKGYTKRYKVKSRTVTAQGMDLAIECSVTEPEKLTEALRALPEAERFSLIEYDAEDIV